jgi:hypothetical protein
VAIVPNQFVAPPEPRGLRYGLITAANGPLSLPTPHGLGGGVRYEPVSCGHAHRWDVDCDTSFGSALAKTFDPADETQDAEPFLIYSSYTCGSVGRTPAEVEAKVRRRLSNGEQTAVEAAMADELAAAATVLTAPDPGQIESVIGALQQWLYGSAAGQQQYGNVGYLHLPVRLESYMAADMLLEKLGSVYVTRMGTVVVFGGGYPDDGRVWISGNVTLWRADDVHVPDIRQTLDRESNQWMGLAEREYAVAFDCHAAVATFTEPT